MFCTKCGAQVKEDQSFCGQCGNKLHSSPKAPPAASAKPTGGMSVASMVLGIVSLVFASNLGLIPMVCGTLGLIFGIPELRKSKKQNDKNPMAFAGVICSAIALGIMALIVLLVVFFFIVLLFFAMLSSVLII